MYVTGLDKLRSAIGKQPDPFPKKQLFSQTIQEAAKSKADGEDTKRSANKAQYLDVPSHSPKHRWSDTISADMKMWTLEKNDTVDESRWNSLIKLEAGRNLPPNPD